MDKSRTSAPHKLVALDSAVAIDGLHALPGPEGAVVLGGAHSFYRSADGQIDVGVWQGSAGRVSIAAYPSDELWHIVSGHVDFRSETGEAQSFGAGDCFVLPKGYSGTAEFSEDFRKVYAMSPALGAA
ncbi:cupin domain-containing protein [Sphingopyxis sp. 550A]